MLAPTGMGKSEDMWVMVMSWSTTDRRSPVPSAEPPSETNFFFYKGIEEEVSDKA